MEQTSTSRPHSLSPEAAAALQRFKTFATAHTLLISVDTHLSRAIEEPAGFAYVLLYGPSGVGKTTLIRQLERRNKTVHTLSQGGYSPETGLLSQPPPVPLLLLEARPPDGTTFNRSDYYRIALKQLGEHTYERRMLVNIDGEHVWEQKKGNGKAAKFNDSSELRQVYEATLQRRGVRTIILDEAQHLLKLASGMKLLDQLDWLKSMSNTTGVLHILTGTYELLALRNLNGQTARRGLEIHFPRYQFQHEPDQRDFQRVLLTLLQQIPLEVDVEPLVHQWSYFYERSIGCIGVLKDWLIRAVAATLAENQPKLLFERIEECVLPIAQCESMAMEAAAGEQELHYTASRRHHLWTLLGMNTEAEVQKEPPAKAPEPQKGSRVGMPQPVRYDVGKLTRSEHMENCSFSGATIALIPTQLEQAGVAKLQCPECGAAQKARVRGEVVFYPTHHPPLKKRSQNMPRWIREGTTWTLTQ